jgi:integrase/recombinase XerD
MQQTLPKIIYTIITHRGQNRIAIKFDYNLEWINRLRKNTDAKWSKTMQTWHISDTTANRIKCKIPLQKTEPAQNVANKKILITPISTNTLPKIQKSITTPHHKKNAIANCNNHILPKVQQHLILLAYSKSTQKTYLSEMNVFLEQIGKRNADNLTTNNLKAYLQYCLTKLNLSENTIHSRLNAIKFYYEQVCKKEKLFFEIPRPKKPLQLPKILNETELKRLFNAASNLKHKAILFLAYSAGLRVSEVINLRLQDIDREREQLFVHCSKGKKDRYVRLSPLVLDILEQYYKLSNPKPKNYVFESYGSGKQYTIRSAQQIFADCRQKAGIIKSLSFHSMRHSFATHMLEKGIDVIFIKELLGHFDIKTTERYLHIRKDFLINLESPIDNLFKK